jgi:hypothetical protein
MEAIRFEHGLSALVHHDTLSILGHLALAELTGVSGRAHDWLRERLDSEPGNKVWIRWFGQKSSDEIASLWEALRQGGSREIMNSVRAAVRKPQDKSGLSLAFDSIIEPLVLLGRGAMVRAVHAALPESLGASFAEEAALALGACGEWDDALGVLEQAHRDGANPHINLVTESSLWRHAYLQGEVDTVLPRLAAIPFHRDRAHAAEGRVWQLVAYRLRAGRTDIHVPAIAKARQPFGYAEAAAMAIAALEGTPSAAQAVAELRRVLAPRTTTMHFVDRGIAVEWTPDDLATARIRVAARRKNYAKLSMLAEGRSSSLLSLSGTVIDALLEEGDWRGAAEFAARYDPRDQPVIEGFDDTRLDEHCHLQRVLAAAAARGGGDGAARAHLAEYVAALRSMRDADQGVGGAKDADVVAPGLWATTVLAGAAEGVIPRRFLAMLLSVFRASI